MNIQRILLRIVGEYGTKKMKKSWTHRFRGNRTKQLKNLYQWILGGFTVWFICLFFIFQGIVGEIVKDFSGPSDLVVPYDKQLAFRISEMTSGYPLEQMSEYIARFDEQTAGYLVSIAKKESDWGRRVPVSQDGEDCYNYWGFRDPDNILGSSGHTCFNRPEQAVLQVGKRIRTLVHTYKRDTPTELVVWKCGNACDMSEESVQKWIRDVDWGYEKFMKSRVLGAVDDRREGK